MYERRCTSVSFPADEKMRIRGASALSDFELVQLLLGGHLNGRKSTNTARQVLRVYDKSNGIPSIQSFKEIPGIGNASANRLSAVMEFARRRIHPGGTKIETAQDVYTLLRHYADRPQEYFLSISLKGSREVIASRVVTIGLLSKVLVHPREVFADPLTDRAAAVIVAHNHPSGDLNPSQNDVEITRRLQEAGDILGIPLLDHVILSQSGYYSFAEHGFFVREL